MKTHSFEQIDDLANSAKEAFQQYRKSAAHVRASLLRKIGKKLDARRKQLIALAAEETSLPPDRLDSEVSRTVNQCYLFADLLIEGSWVRAIIDKAIPARRPIPRPDLRQMQIAAGPVAVFGASNFPFAYSVFGGDTAAALAAGCTVVYKVNPGHPRTSDAVAAIVTEEIAECGLHPGVFAIIHGASTETGMRLVKHPAICAVGFTGSLKAGRAIFDAAASREEPIPVYAEMGSTNPVFILPRILENKSDELAEMLYQSNTASAGQFCTNPGILVTTQSTGAAGFRAKFADLIRASQPQAMLNPGILNSFTRIVKEMSQKPNISLLSASQEAQGKTGAFMFHADANAMLGDEDLWQEMFGPASMHVGATPGDLMQIARAMPGQITASVWGTDEDFIEFGELISYLQLKAGRIIINGVPTGVEVSPAMNHGGPYPATTDPKFTSVGTQSIYRFTRPVCFQNYPGQLLPAELQDENPLSIWRLVNGEWTKDCCA